MKQIIQFFLVGLVLLTVVMVYDGFFILKEGQQAMITQFGAPVGLPKTEARLYLKKPFIQDVSFFDKRIQIWDGAPNQIEIIRSSDWSLDTMTNPRNNDAPPKLGRDGISEQVLAAAAKLTPQYGIELLDVMFKRVNYIESVRLKVYDRMISERKRIAAERRSTGEGKKAEILGKVERELNVILSEANREASEIKGEADASATKIYGEVYGQDPEFYSFYKTLESYKKVIGENTSLILSSESDLFRYLQKID